MSSKDLTEALGQLTQEASGKKDGPPDMKARGEAPAVKSSALLGSSAGAGGIASPLIESAYANRTFHAERNLLSTDGLFSLKIKPVKTIVFKDAANRDVSIEFKAPS